MNRLVTSDERRVCRFLHAPRGASTSAAKVTPVLDSSSDRGIAIDIKVTIICERLITYNTHRIEPSSIKQMTMSRGILDNGVW